MKELAKKAAFEHEYPELHLFDLLLDAGSDVGWRHDTMAAHSGKEAEYLHSVRRHNEQKANGYSGWSVESGEAKDLGTLDTQNLPQEKIDAYKKEYQELSGKNESLTEAKRYVRRYYMKPQNIFCSNKSEILKALIDHEDEDCTIYTLINLGDVKDVGKLNSKDIIYYYEDGILYDKNYVRIMDYDLSIKHEEERANINPETTSDAKFADVYDDRMTGATELEETINNYFTEDLNEAKEDKICCICGEPIEGYGNNPEPYEDYSYEKGDRCCDKCNMHFVLPARLEGIKK